MTVLAIAFARAPASQSPNIRRRSHGDSASVYYAAMEVAFASAARWDRSLRLRLVTDAEPPVGVRPALGQLGVAIDLVDFAHRPPPGFFEHFSASLYTIDAMQAMAGLYPDEDLGLIDPDCLVVRPPAPLFRDCATAIGALPIGVPPGERVNGLSAEDARPLHALLDPSLTGPPEHFGGEVYTFRDVTIRPVLERAEAAHALALDLHARGERKFTTEEHLLNYALRQAPVSRLDDRVRRIWTAPRLRQVGVSPEELVAWHLPAEKDRGFPRVRQAVLDESSWFWTAGGDEFRAELGRHFGIPRRSPVRWGYDTGGGAVRRAQALVGPRR